MPNRDGEPVEGGATRVPTGASARRLPARTQQERRLDAEARLLAAARKILAHKGWAGMTLADVGEAAGYSRGLAGHYFGSKAGLLQAITLQINDSFMEEIASRPSPEPGLETIISFIETYLGRGDPIWTNTRTMLILLTETLLDTSANTHQMSNFNASMFTYLEDNIRIGVDKGEIDASVTPSVAAEYVVGTLRGMMLQRLVSGDVRAPELARTLVTLIRRSLAAPQVDAPEPAGRPPASRRPLT